METLVVFIMASLMFLSSNLTDTEHNNRIEELDKKVDKYIQQTYSKPNYPTIYNPRQQ